MDDTEPSGRAPAPGGLRLVQAFVNTNDIEGGQDELGTPQQLRDWLTSRGLMKADADVTDADLHAALEAREALRSLAATNNGEPSDPAANKALNRIGEDSSLRVRFSGDGVVRLEPAADGVSGALAFLLASVQVATINGTWSRFKACRNGACRWAFYDHSKNHSGTWCSMAECGDKLKARAYRRRRRS